MNKRLAIGTGMMALGIGWTTYGIIQYDVAGDIFTDNTLGLGIVTIVMSLFILKKMKRNAP